MSSQKEPQADALLHSDLRVVNIGLREFARELAACKVTFIHVAWSPPAVTNAKIASLLDKLGG
jgi:hypothetical protein